MKYINQLDYPHWLYVTRTSLEDGEKEKGKTTTVKSSGCDICSAIMIADRLIPNCDFGLKEAIDLSYQVKANHTIGTDYDLYAPALAEKLGLRLEMTNAIERLRYCVRTGGAAVLNVGGDYEGHVGIFTHRGHYIAVISENVDGRFVVLDPAYELNKFEEEGRYGKVEVKDHEVILCDEQTLAEEVANRSPGLFLFWRA